MNTEQMLAAAFFLVCYTGLILWLVDYFFGNQAAVVEGVAEDILFALDLDGAVRQALTDSCLHAFMVKEDDDQDFQFHILIKGFEDSPPVARRRGHTPRVRVPVQRVVDNGS